MKKLKNDPEVRKLHREVIKWHNAKFDKLTGIKKVNGKLKLFTPEAEITYKMKKIVSAIKKVTLHLNILSLLIFFACGSDNPVNNGNPPPSPVTDSLAHFIDTLSTSTVTVQSQTVDSTIITDLSIGDSIKISFTVESNCDSTHNPSASGTFGNISFNLSLNEFNQSYVYYGRLTSIFINFHLSINTFIGDTRYLRFTQIKMYKVNPV